MSPLVHCRYDLLPFYSRMVASLYPCMPSIANDLALMLKTDFRYHVSLSLYVVYDHIDV